MRTLYTLISILGLLCCSCNNEIFVEPLPDFPDEIYLDGFEGTQIVTIPQAGLEDVSFGDSYGLNWQPFTIYYDKDGNELNSPSKISDVSKVLYVCQMFAVEFNIRGDEVEVVALDNAYTSPVEMWMCLYYGYAVKYLNIKIGVGRPLEIKQFSHFIGEYVVETETVRVSKGNTVNDTGQPITVSLFPYKDASSKLTLLPTDEDDWSRRAAGIVGVPLYNGREWSLYDTEDVEATIGSTTNFFSKTTDENEKGYFDVPANSAVSASLYVTYAKLKTGYTATVGFPNVDIDWIVNGTLEVMQPIDYKIETTILDL
ncbi:MAG: hypothetical protein NC453_13855 [Muribaculum sp.]|nr:hypothetical protein [Muribaculum sp.]